MSFLENKIKILFLGYSSNETNLISKLVDYGCDVSHTKDKNFSTDEFDLVISFGYKHIIKKNTIINSKIPIINLHISYLPWNRGAHPNFWSFFDCTPSGVSIHLIDENIDTGPILYQRYVNFDKNENTFRKTYNRLLIEIEKLFVDNMDMIIRKNYSPIFQRRSGSFHSAGDLPADFNGWDSDIQSEITRLDKLVHF